jgi:hypothetical protein
MKAWLSTLWNASLLRTEAFTAFRDRRDVFFQGFLIIVAVALFVGLPAFASSGVKAVLPRTSEAQLEEGVAPIESILHQAEPILGSMPAETRRLVETFVGVGKTVVAAGVEIENLEARLPRPLGRLLEALGGWLSLPFREGGCRSRPSLWRLGSAMASG